MQVHDYISDGEGAVLRELFRLRDQDVLLALENYRADRNVIRLMNLLSERVREFMQQWHDASERGSDEDPGEALPPSEQLAELEDSYQYFEDDPWAQSNEDKEGGGGGGGGGGTENEGGGDEDGRNNEERRDGRRSIQRFGVGTGSGES